MSNLFLKQIKVCNVLYFVLCVLFANCTHTTRRVNGGDISVEDNGIKEIPVISNLSKSERINISTIASNIDYCLLETDKNCLVTPGMSVYCAKDYVVTIGTDGPNHAVCYVFDRKTGKFVRQISRMGQGPEEYTGVVSSFWDGINEQVCVWNRSYYIFYNLDGVLSHKINFKSDWSALISYGNHYVGYVQNPLGKASVRIVFFDKTGSLIDSIPNHRFWNRTQKSAGRSPDGRLYIFLDDLYYKDIYGDTLYYIKDFEIQPRYIFNTGGLAVPYEIQEGGRYDYEATLRGGEYDRYRQYVFILEIIEDSKYLYFTVEYQKQLYPALYDKTEDNLQIMSPISIPPFGRDRRFPRYGFENDLDGGLPFWPQQMISDKEMICVYTAEELLELDASKITDEKLKHVLNSLEEDSNPVVAIVILKD